MVVRHTIAEDDTELLVGRLDLNYDGDIVLNLMSNNRHLPQSITIQRGQRQDGLNARVATGTFNQADNDEIPYRPNSGDDSEILACVVSSTVLH